jgi:hypothetical protein
MDTTEGFYKIMLKDEWTDEEMVWFSDLPWLDLKKNNFNFQA